VRHLLEVRGVLPTFVIDCGFRYDRYVDCEATACFGSLSGVCGRDVEFGTVTLVFVRPVVWLLTVVVVDFPFVTV
jgi:hypothetical protein